MSWNSPNLLYRVPGGGAQQPSTSNGAVPQIPQYPTHHQDYLNRLHASALADQQAALRSSINRNSRKRAAAASPGYSELDLANLMAARHSPTSLQLLNAAAAANGSPSSSGSYGHLSGIFAHRQLLNLKALIEFL